MNTVLKYFFVLAYSATAFSSSLQSDAARYYYQHQDYPKALSLWEKVLAKQPRKMDVILRVAELKLLLEGRPSLQEFIGSFLAENSKELSVEHRRLLGKRIRALQSRFLTDQGQAKFLQSQKRKADGDYREAIQLLDQASAAEKGNEKVLLLRAECEKKLEQWDRMFSTLKQALQSNPLNSKTLEKVFEAYIYFGDYDAVLKEIDSRPGVRLSSRQRTAWGVSLWHKGKRSSALWVLRQLLNSRKDRRKHPILYFAVGKILMEQRRTQGEGAAYLEQFLSLESNPKRAHIEGWDPYRSGEYLAEAKSLLQGQS